MLDRVILHLFILMTFQFVGGSYELANVRADSQVSLNVYPEVDETKQGKSPASMVGAPGYELFSTLPTQPFRGMFMGDGRMFVVSGPELYEVFQDGTFSDLGNVQDDGLPVTFAVNGNQLAVVSNGYIWVDSGSGPVRPTFPGTTSVASYVHYYAGLSATLVEWVSGDKFDATMNGQTVTIGGDTGYFTYKSETRGYVGIHLFPEDVVTLTVPGHFIPASAVSWLDGFAVVSIPESSQINISAHPFDFSDWDSLDVAVKEGYPDHILRPFVQAQDLFLMGKQTLEVWRNNGNPDFPFGLVPGMILNLGLQAKDSVARLGTGIVGLFGDERGAPIAYIIEGYTPRRISTHPLEKLWATYSTISDAVGFSYEDCGHKFWQVSFPSADATFVYDLTTGYWHQRGTWDGTTLHRSRAAFHGYVWGQHYVGDWQTGNIYRMSSDLKDDAGTPMLFRRTAPCISNENERIYLGPITLDVEPGEISGAQFTLYISRDGGHTYGPGRTITGGAVGDYLARFVWRRNGHSRFPVIRIESTSPMRHRWINAYVGAHKGTS
jgi:hypothetical protein